MNGGGNVFLLSKLESKNATNPPTTHQTSPNHLTSHHPPPNQPPSTTHHHPHPNLKPPSSPKPPSIHSHPTNVPLQTTHPPNNHLNHPSRSPQQPLAPLGRRKGKSSWRCHRGWLNDLHPPPRLPLASAAGSIGAVDTSTAL